MKNRKGMIIITASVLLIVLITAGCKYDVNDPVWDKPYNPPPSTTISQITPANSADAGVNTITITGTNFSDSLSGITVQFGNAIAEIESLSPTSITVRRPNISGDDLTVMINSFNSFLVAKQQHYKVARVLEKSNAFNDNVQLSALACDKSSNLYVGRLKTPFSIWKITPTGDKTLLVDTITNKVAGKLSSDITDIRVYGHYLYLIRANKTIQRVDVNIGRPSISAWFNTGKASLRFGDFDPDGYLYAGGVTTGLLIIGQDSTFTQMDATTYTKDSINAVRVAKIGSDRYVYVAATSSTTKGVNKIFRHKIIGSKSLGPQELVVDLSSTPYATKKVKGLSIDETGNVYIGINSAETILIYTPADNKLDILYKGILPSYCNQAVFDNATNIYILSGNGTNPNWNLHRIDVGKKGAF